MLSRRSVLTGATATLAAPYVLSRPAKAQASRIRRDITAMTLDNPFFGKYAEAISAMHELPDSDNRHWRNQAIIHANHCPHGMSDFLEWHRYYITYFERICGELIGDTDFALGYWNWSNNNGLLPRVFFERSLLNVVTLNDPSNYDVPSSSRSNWPSPIQSVATTALSPTVGLGNDPRFSRIFSESAIDDLKRQPNFDRFMRLLEGQPHNTAHVLTGSPNGHMIDGLSSLDPVFWLHHCNVDRIWAEWQAAENVTPPNSMVYNGQFFDRSGSPVNVAANDSHDFRNLGFTYDTTEGLVASLLDPSDLPMDTMFAELSIDDSGVKTLGSAEGSFAATVDIPSPIPVAIAGLSEELFNQRTFRATQLLSAPRNAVEPSRFIATFNGVTYPKADQRGVIVNVFINCPYLAPDTPSTDDHFAGSFAFFGQLMKGMEDGATFYVDITDPVRRLAEQGRLEANSLNIQLMPVTVTPEGPKEAEFTVSSVEVTRV